MRRIILLILFFSIVVYATSLGFPSSKTPKILLSQYVHTSYKDSMDEEVLDITQDKNGYIWLATYNGLIRFDGNEFVTFNKSTRTDFDAYSVRTILVDESGALLVGTNEDGLAKYANNKFTFFEAPEGLLGDSVRVLTKDTQKRLWIGTATGLCMYDGKVFHSFSENKDLTSNLINFIFEDSKGNIWVGANAENGMYVMQKNKSSFEKYAGPAISELAGNIVMDMLEDKNKNNMWFLLKDKAVIVNANGVKNKVEWGNDKSLQGYMDEEHIYYGRNGSSIWITGGALFSYEGDRLIRYGTENGLRENVVSSFLEDREGNIWIGSKSGLDKYTIPKFVAYGKDEGIPDMSVNALLENKPGEIWIGSDGGLGILNITDGGNDFYYSPLLENTRIRHLLRDSHGTVWVATYGKGLLSVKNNRVIRAWTKEDGLAGEKIRTTFEDSKGNLWIGTTDGLSIMHPDGIIRNFGADQGMQNSYIMAIQESVDGKIWVGTDGGGVYVFQGEEITDTLTEKDGLPGSIILRIYRDKAGLIWIVSSSGLSKYDNKKLSSCSYQQLGIINTAFQIFESDNGKVWLTTTEGVYCISRSKLDGIIDDGGVSTDIKLYNRQSGLNGNPTSTAWGITDHKSDIWVPTVAGVARINPNNYSINALPPSVVINRVSVDDSEIIPNGETIIVPPKAKRVTFHFSALSYNDPAGNLLQYKLEGYDDDWSMFSDRQETIYTNLHYGTYTFMVRGRNSDGILSTHEAEIKINKEAVFYEKAWFISLAVLLGLFVFSFIISVIYKYRVKHLHAKLEQKETQLLLERKATEIERIAKEREIQLSTAASSFVPHDFLKYLGKESILDIRAGDHIENNVTVMFSDIRSYTKISENMSSLDIFKMINRFLYYAVNTITENNGFIDKFIGDAIMGIFPDSPDDALTAVINLNKELAIYNEERAMAGEMPLKVGVGIHYGNVTLGTVGTEKRMDTTIIGDTVNLASRLESATKNYSVNIIISDEVYDNLKHPEHFCIRKIDMVRVKGKLKPVVLYEVFDNDDEFMRMKKIQTQECFKSAFDLYQTGDFSGANELFKSCQEVSPDDPLLSIYIKRCSTMMRIPPGADWSGISGL